MVSHHWGHHRAGHEELQPPKGRGWTESAEGQEPPVGQARPAAPGRGRWVEGLEKRTRKDSRPKGHKVKRGEEREVHLDCPPGPSAGMPQPCLGLGTPQLALQGRDGKQERLQCQEKGTRPGLGARDTQRGGQMFESSKAELMAWRGTTQTCLASLALGLENHWASQPPLPARGDWSGTF